MASIQARQGRRVLLLSLLCPVSILTGCSSSLEEARGLIAQTGNGVVRVEPGREEELCGADDSKCEPNYVYRMHMGAGRKKDKMDYSRAILKVEEGWKITEGSATITVAVIDTGSTADHPDLKGNVLQGYDFVHDRSGAVDDNQHGTHVSGIVAALHNGAGTVGVAPKVKILPLKFLDAGGSGDTAAAIQAIDFAVANGAKILSNSWGGGGRSRLLEEAIERAVAAGIFVVASAGNDASNNEIIPSYPASYTDVISVASSDSADQLSSFSNYGLTSVWIAAPGSDIYSTLPAGKYGNLSGTSMSAPQVSGALALALSVKPDLTLEQAKDLLCDSARKILTQKTACGRLDVAEFVRRVAAL